MGTTLQLLCAGAAQGLVKALQPRLLESHGATIAGRFGAVGAMQEALLAGEACDLMIATDAMIAELATRGALRGDTRTPLGRVSTGIAVRRGTPRPEAASASSLRAALRAADTIYFPDPQRATAGIHFAAVMRRLGVHDELQPRFRTFPNGATAMRELAASTAPRPIGCTQVSEILDTDGVDLLGPLPEGYGLATVYSAALSANAAEPALAEAFIALLAGADSVALRRAGGFEP